MVTNYFMAIQKMVSIFRTMYSGERETWTYLTTKLEKK